MGCWLVQMRDKQHLWIRLLNSINGEVNARFLNANQAFSANLRTPCSSQVVNIIEIISTVLFGLNCCCSKIKNLLQRLRCLNDYPCLCMRLYFGRCHVNKLKNNSNRSYNHYDSHRGRYFWFAIHFFLADENLWDANLRWLLIPVLLLE